MGSGNLPFAHQFPALGGEDRHPAVSIRIVGAIRVYNKCSCRDLYVAGKCNVIDLLQTLSAFASRIDGIISLQIMAVVRVFLRLLSFLFCAAGCLLIFWIYEVGHRMEFAPWIAWIIVSNILIFIGAAFRAWANVLLQKERDKAATRIYHQVR
jgi:hypothetical protein